MLENYVADTSTFRSTVAWSYVLTYSSSLVALFLLPMIPWQKEDAQRRKKESGSSCVRATVVICDPVHVPHLRNHRSAPDQPSRDRVLVEQPFLLCILTCIESSHGSRSSAASRSQETACLQWIGGQGCD